MVTARRRLEEQYPLRLHNGDRMRQPEFHRIYCGMPEDYHAELIGGMVFEPSPVSDFHGSSQVDLAYLFKAYSIATPGVKAAAGVTLILSEEDEVEPDLMLRIAQECGGRSYRTRRGFIKGAPELVAEVAYSSRAIDLHLKRERYARAGIAEYVVLSLKPKKIHWFDLPGGAQFRPHNGIFWSRILPGLWIHERGLLDSADELMRAALEQGLKMPEHDEFVARLAKARNR